MSCVDPITDALALKIPEPRQSTAYYAQRFTLSDINDMPLFLVIEKYGLLFRVTKPGLPMHNSTHLNTDVDKHGQSTKKRRTVRNDIQCLVANIRGRAPNSHREFSRMRTCRRLEDSNLTGCDTVVNGIHEIMLNLVCLVWMMKVLAGEVHCL